MNYKKITKIQYKGEKLKIEWLQNAPSGHTDKKSIETKTEPHNDFVKAFRQLDKHLCREAELTMNDEEFKRHDIQLVQLSYEKDEMENDVMFASITSERMMESSDEFMKITSPMKPETASLGLPLHSDTVDAIDKLIQETVLFLDGKRHDLFSMTATAKAVVND